MPQIRIVEGVFGLSGEGLYVAGHLMGGWKREIKEGDETPAGERRSLEAESD